MATREPELYKDKVEVSLDGRQIFYLFFGGAVLVGVVFVLGVMVGRRVESRSHVDRLDHGRATSDPLAALDTLESRKGTFQEALTKTELKTPVETQIEDLAKTRPPARPDGARDSLARDDKKPEVKLEAKPVEPASAKPDADKKPATEKLEKKDKKEKKATEPKVLDVKEPVTKPEQAKVEKAKKPVIDERVNADVITALDPPKAEPKPAVDPKEAKGKFTLQLSSFQDKQEAETFLSSVKAAGYQAYVTAAEVSGKGTFYRVRMGKYGSMDAANDAKADVEKAIKKSASVMRL